jgi:hypothetical protein
LLVCVAMPGGGKNTVCSYYVVPAPSLEWAQLFCCQLLSVSDVVLSLRKFLVSLSHIFHCYRI